MASNQSNQAKAFPSLQELPVEMRSMIWKACLNIPQVFGIADTDSSTHIRHDADQVSVKCSTGPHSSLLRVNKETRLWALKIQKKLEAWGLGGPNIYVNLRIDTIWYVDEPVFDDKDVSWIGLDNPYVQIPKLAITYRGLETTIEKYKQGDQDSLCWFMDNMNRHGFKELTLVVGSHGKSRFPNMEMVRPHPIPQDALSYEMLESLSSQREKSWETLAANTLQYIRKEQAELIRIWKDFLSRGYTQEDLDKDDMLEHLSPRLEAWHYPSLRYAAVTTPKHRELERELLGANYF